jgi:hypothetical protein
LTIKNYHNIMARVVLRLILGGILTFVGLWVTGCGSLNGTNTPVSEEDRMASKGNQVVSAQVVLRSASGERLANATAITTDNIGEFMPSATTIAKARQAFIDAGFDVGNVVGNSFAITAPIATFEKVFKTQLQLHDQNNMQFVEVGKSGGYELPLDTAPASITGLVEAITFTSPPDFGPNEFMP